MQILKTKIFLLPALGVGENYYAPLIEGLKSHLQANVSTISPPAAGNFRQRLSASIKIGYLEMVDSICTAVQAYKREHPDHAVILFGHSLGGHFAMLAASRLESVLHGVVLVASGSPHWGAWPEHEQPRLRRGVRIVSTLTKFLPWYPGTVTGFGGSQPRTLMLDWCHFANNGQLFTLRGCDSWRIAADQLKLPVLTVHIEGDTLAPETATDQLLLGFGNIARTSVTLHANQLPIGPAQRRHFTWCRQPEPTCQLVTSWLSHLRSTGDD
jgi:predicted alpha/beta hydrolase